MANIGVRPTVSDGEHVNVESHLIGFSGNLYGQQVRVEFCKFLRPEVKFEDNEELARQIRRDIVSAGEYLRQII